MWNEIKVLALRLLRGSKKSDSEKNTYDYWNTRWSLKLREDNLDPKKREKIVWIVKNLMNKYDCESVLEVGCGADAPLRDLENAAHLDFSIKALKRSKLSSFIYADITKRIPVPAKTFDASFCSCCLMHLPDQALASACAEVSRVTKKVVILNEGDGRTWAAYFPSLSCQEIGEYL